MAFSREEVLANLLEQFKIFAAIEYGDCQFEPSAEPIRSDIRQHLCPQCEAIQKREMELAMVDFDRLDW
jgi:hypothetical protein